MSLISKSLFVVALVALGGCGDDAEAGCPSPFVLTERGCVLPDAGPRDAADDVAEDAAAPDDAAPEDSGTPDAPLMDIAVDPGGAEVCNGMDDDGDGATDEGLALEMFFLDSDRDDFGDTNMPCEACGAGACGDGQWVSNNMDCDDACDRCFPGGSEVCDERNNDCDASTDEGVTQRFFEDLDRDGFGSEVFVDECAIPDGFAVESGDCADMEPRAHPGAMTYRGEAMTNPPASGLAFDYDCDGMETHEILLEGNPGEVCSRPSCPEIDRWETRPACGSFGDVFRCFSIALNCRALESSQELALCR